MLAQTLSHGFDDYHPPFGSQDIPHPRTIPDIVLRSLFIQLCAALAYAVLQNTLGWSSWQRGSRRYWLFWSLCSVLLPEVLLMQILLRLVGRLVACFTGPSEASLAVHGQKRPTVGGVRTSSMRLALFQVVILGVPLVFAFRGYKQRLTMQWHGATYVANLGLDHRNGWATASGLTSCAGVLLLSIFRAVSCGYKLGNASDRVHRPLDLAENGGEDEFESNTRTSVRAGDSSSFISRTNSATLFGDLGTTLPLYLAASVHQILLAVTNRPPPLVAFLITRWSLSMVPILCISFLLLPQAQRQALQRIHALEKSSDWSLAFALFLQNAAIVTAWFLIASTIMVQAWSDLDELRSVSAGHMQPWNYRWRNKDRFSHGAVGIFMEG